MTGYFELIAARVVPSRPHDADRPAAHPEPPVATDRAVLDDPFETLENDEVTWRSSTSDEAAPPPTPPAEPPPTEAPTAARPTLAPASDEGRSPVDSPPPSTVPQPVDQLPTAPPADGDDAALAPTSVADDPRRADRALRAMDAMLFAAAGVEPPADLPDPIAVPMQPEPPDGAREWEHPPPDARADEAGLAPADTIPAISEPMAPSTHHLGPTPMTPTPDVIEVDAPPSSVNIGRITVEVHEPAPVPGPTPSPAASAPLRSVPFPRAQRLLSAQRRRLG
ncbi:MAG: hypothetical protein GY713_11640 [Actinomycetia bacterium]|nr:hypothetical protein [Actinomycetes bacterium]